MITQYGDGQLHIPAVRYHNFYNRSPFQTLQGLYGRILLSALSWVKSLAHELGPRGTALVSAKTSQEGSDPPGGFDASFTYASRDFLTAACDQSNSAIATGLGINRETLMLWEGVCGGRPRKSVGA